MGWHIDRVERNVCPKEFQERITRVGGLNRYGEPNFKIVWGQNDNIRAGGLWEHDGFVGYRDVPRSGQPCWLILQWNAPELYGTPESYYVGNYDEQTGLQTMGEYPYRGRYETLFSLVWKGLVGSELVVEHMPLSSMLVNTVIPIVMAAKDVSLERKKEAALEMKEREEYDQLRKIDDAMRSAKLAFNGAPFSSRTGRTTPLLDKKIKQIERNMDRALAQIRAMGKGTGTRNTTLEDIKKFQRRT